MSTTPTPSNNNNDPPGVHSSASFHAIEVEKAPTSTTGSSDPTVALKELVRNGNEQVTKVVETVQEKALSIPLVHQLVTVPATYEQLRITNVIAYALNVIITYGVGVMGGIFWSVPTNAQLSAKYQTLVTPASWTFFIWAIIFLSQAAWIAQQYLDSAFRSKSHYNITNMQYKYVAVAICQSFWTITFSHEWLITSLVWMVLLLISLWRIVLLNRNGANVDDDDEEYPAANEVRRSKNGKSLRYWLEEFPFAVHFGWICVALVLNINVNVVSRNSSIDLEYHYAIGSLIIIAIAAVYFLFSLEYITVPVVFVWALVGIYNELQNDPSASIVSQYSTNQIDTVIQTALWIGTAIAIGVTCRIAYSLTQKCKAEDEYYEDPEVPIESSSLATPYVAATETKLDNSVMA